MCVESKDEAHTTFLMDARLNSSAIPALLWVSLLGLGRTGHLRLSFLLLSLLLPNVTVCLFGGRTLGGHLGLDHLRSCRMRQPLGVSTRRATSPAYVGESVSAGLPSLGEFWLLCSHCVEQFRSDAPKHRYYQ